MKKLILIVLIILTSCSNQGNTDNYVGTWVPDGYGNKYSKITIEKADGNELRMVLYNSPARWNFIMVPDGDDRIKSTESLFGAHIIFKYENNRIVDYNLNQSYKLEE